MLNSLCLLGSLAVSIPTVGRGRALAWEKAERGREAAVKGGDHCLISPARFRGVGGWSKLDSGGRVNFWLEEEEGIVKEPEMGVGIGGLS